MINMNTARHLHDYITWIVVVHKIHTYMLYLPAGRLEHLLSTLIEIVVVGSQEFLVRVTII